MGSSTRFPLRPSAPLLSICIPTYNRIHWLRRCLDHCIGQTEALDPGLVEVVVSENAGTDGSWDLLQDLAELHPCLQIHRNPENVRAENFNVVVGEARGQYVWLMGDDDAPVPGGLAKVVDLIQTTPRDLYLLHCQEVDLEGKPLVVRQWFQDLPSLDWDLSDRSALMDYLNHAQYMAAVFAFISVLVFDREAWLEAAPDLREAEAEGWPHVARGLKMIRTRGLVRVVEEVLLINTAGNDGYEKIDPWARAMADLQGWLRLGVVFFPRDIELRQAFMGPLRRNRQSYLLHHFWNYAPSREAWEKTWQPLQWAGVPALDIAAYDLAGKMHRPGYTPSSQLEAEALCLADLGFITRGSRRVLIMTARAVGEDLGALLELLKAHTRAELKVLCSSGSPAPPGADGERVSCSMVDLVRVAGDRRYQQELGAALRDFAPDLVLNLDPERRPSWDILAMEAGAVAGLAFRAPERQVPPELAAWLDSGYTRLLPPGPTPTLAAALGLALPAPPATAVIWEGSQFVYHSLAHVNRQLCLGLLASGKVDLSLLPYEPDQFGGVFVPAFRPLAARVRKALAGPAAVHVRHQWPPHFQPPAQGAWVMIQPWEFGGIPAEWVAPMRDQVDEIWVPSTWLKDCYVQSGIPGGKVVVVPNGVDCKVFCPEGERFPLNTSKGCRFLFVGGTIQRKGFDLLLDAFVKTFRASDDVCLVIKAQGGGVYGGPDLPELLRKLREADPQAPEIEYRPDDLSEPQMAALYRACDVLVLPYRGEGFGLPIAEGMASGLPVLVTGRGASRDFVREEWAYLIPSRTVAAPDPGGFTPSRAGFWLEEPDGAALGELMKRAYADPGERRAKGARGREHARAELGWDKPVALMLERLAALAGRSPRRDAPPDPVGQDKPEAFFYRPDWSKAEWAEVLLSYILAFRPGEPVALVMPRSGAAGEPTLEQIQVRVLELVKGSGVQTFPDVVLVDNPGELPEVLAGYAPVTQVPAGRGAVAGLRGAYGLRLAEARTRLCQANNPK